MVRLASSNKLLQRFTDNSDFDYQLSSFKLQTTTKNAHYIQSNPPNTFASTLSLLNLYDFIYFDVTSWKL